MKKLQMLDNILIIGADHLGDIEKKLNKIGFKIISHIDGRSVTEGRLKIPKNTDLVLVFTDFVNHNLVRVVKDQAKSRALPICYSKRSWSSIHKSIVPFISQHVLTHKNKNIYLPTG